MYVYIFVLVVDSILEMIKLVGIVVYNFIVLMCYIFWFYCDNYRVDRFIEICRMEMYIYSKCSIFCYC